MLKINPKLKRIYLRYMHLGDIITTFNILYNLGLQKNLQFEISGQNPDVYKQLIKIFDYKNYFIFKDFCPWKFGFETLFFSDFLPYYYLNMCLGIGTVGKIKLKSCCLPKCKINVQKTDDFLCFQFKCRSVESRKSFTNENIKHSFEKFEIKKSICIGGLETQKYINNRDVFFAELPELADKLLQSSGFFGIDSGMSHLAGSLGLPCDVVVQAKYDDFFWDVKRAFEFMYPSVTIHSKESIVNSTNLI